MKSKLIYCLILCLTVFSCKKPEDRKCWKGSGEIAFNTVQLDNFHTVIVKPKIQLTLVPDTINYIEIIGYEHLNNLISYDIKEGALTIINDNKCDFLRSYKKKSIPVRLHCKDLRFLDFHGTDPVYTEGIITGDKFDYQCIDGAGTVHLNIDVMNFSAVLGNGFGDYIVSGTCQNAKHVLTNNGYADALNLVVTENLDVVNRSQADGKFNVSGTTNVRLQTTAKGNIYYRGEATNLIKDELGTGRIYQIN